MLKLVGVYKLLFSNRGGFSDQFQTNFASPSSSALTTETLHHRHSKNLAFRISDSLGLLGFQDALFGTVSLHFSAFLIRSQEGISGFPKGSIRILNMEIQGSTMGISGIPNFTNSVGASPLQAGALACWDL